MASRTLTEPLEWQNSHLIEGPLAELVAGSGRKLFEAGDPTTRLSLKDQYRTTKGNVVSTYGLLGE